MQIRVWEGESGEKKPQRVVLEEEKYFQGQELSWNRNMQSEKGERGAHTRASRGLHRQLRNKAALCPMTLFPVIILD